MTRAKTFVCVGKNDGACGEKHRSAKAATECCDRRWRKVPRTDREPRHPDGSEMSIEDASLIRTWKATRELVRA